MNSRHQAQRKTLALPVWAAALIWFLTYLGSRLALEDSSLSPSLRTAVALVPVLPFVLFLMAQGQALRDLDELERRIQLEALAIAFPGALLLIMTLGLLQLAIPLSPADWSYRHIWPFLFLFYFLGLALTRRRYR
jgi:hypothetical protein